MGAIYLDANTESDIYGTGNSVAGTVLGSGAINVTGNGCSVFGYAQDSSALQTEGWGNVACGAAAAGGAVEARVKGTFAAGQAAGGLLRTDAAANGAIAMGYALDNSLIASGNGAIAIGMADASSPLAASGEASVAIGRGINNTLANCMVVGHYPRMAAMTTPTLTANNSTSTETVFAVGCGSNTNPINGLRVT